MSFVSANIAYVRRSLGLSQAQLADDLGIKRSLLGAYEEARATPRYDVLEKLEKLSGHTPSDLLNRKLLPEGYEPPTKRGRTPGIVRPASALHATAPTYVGSEARVAYAQPAPSMPQAEAPAPTSYPATLTLTVDTAGMPQASLVGYAELSRYAGQSNSAAYVAGLPALSLPLLDANHAYRAFEVQPGQIHISRLIRNWGGILPSEQDAYVLVYRSGIMLGTPFSAGKGLSWNPMSSQPQRPRPEEPLEIWQSEWVLTRNWQPLPAQLGAIADRLAALEAKLG